MEQNGTVAALTPQQERAIVALLTEPNLSAAARVCSCGRTTLWRWMTQDDPFRKALLEARKQAFAEAGLRLVGACVDAAATLREIATNAEASDAARVSASRAILERAMGALETEDILVRLERLESAQETR